MKFRTVVFGVSCFVLASSAFAGRKYGMAGCGLGSAVFGTGGLQTSAATTNGTFGSQLFGITSGTSNCTPDKDEVVLLKQESFIVANYSTLSKEMAKGSGESIVGLAQTFGCQERSIPQFGSFLQSRYSSILAAPGSMAMLDTLKSELAADSALSSACPLSQIY